MPACPLISLSPSFNSYSNCKLVGIAARVADEFDSDDFHDELYFNKREHSADQRAEQGRNSHHRDPDDDDGDEDFEFAFATRDSQSSSQISADEIFQNGKIRPVNPVFNRDLLLGHVKFQNEKDNWNSDSSEAPKVRHPLRKLFNEERETTSSSEAVDLDGVAAETYCVWRPKAESAEEDGQCRKSSSTGGNSKRWRFKDLLHRSHSYGSKDNVVLLSHTNTARKRENETKVKETPEGGGKVKSAPPPPPSYNPDGGEKLRSYLPYRQHLVGFFGNVNGLRELGKI